MKRRGSLFVVLSFAVLTITLTGIVIFAWEKLLMTPFYARVEAMYPGEANSSTRWRVEQRIEHFVISTTVDVIVVTLLLRLVGRQQRKLAASEERYRALFEHANDGIAIVTADSHSIIEVNNKFCDIFRCRPQELVGKDIRDPVWGLLGGLVCDTLPALLDGSGGGESEVSIHDSAGVERPVSVSCSTLSMDKERLVILIIRDLSERKRLEAEKEEMQRRLFHNEKIAALGRVAAQVAHEVKNPLAGLLLYAMHLKTKLTDKLNDGELTLIDRIINSINHLVGTTEQILSFARPVSLSPRPVDLNGVVQKAVQLLQPQINAFRVKEELDLAPGELVALVDESSITSALINLTLNAVQSMPAGGRLTVKTRQHNGSIRLTLADTGCGMSREQIEKVFEPFYTTKSQGLGLGMPYAKKVIEQHRGSIRIESSRDEGTQINIELPAEKRVTDEPIGV